MAFPPAASEQDVYSTYLNLDACDPYDEYTTDGKDLQLPPLEFSLLEPWHDTPITPSPLDPKASQEACWNTSSYLGPFSPMPMNDFTLLSPIVSSLGCFSSADWPLVDDEDSVTQDDMTIPLIQRRNPSPPCLPVPPPMADFYGKFTGAEQFDCPALSSSPSSSSSSLSGTDSDYSSLFSPGTSALTSPASSVLSLDDVRRSCSVSPETRLPSPGIRGRNTMENTSEKESGLVTQDSRKSNLKGRRKQKRATPLSSKKRRRRLVSSGDPQDQDPDQLPYSDAVNDNGKKRPQCACGESFTRPSDLRRHRFDSTSCKLRKPLLEKQTEVDPRLICPECSKQFSRADSRDRHLRTLNGCRNYLIEKRKKQLKLRKSDDNDDD